MGFIKASDVLAQFFLVFCYLFSCK